MMQVLARLPGALRSAVQVILNGQPVEVKSETTITDLMGRFPAPHPAYAVEVNRQVVPRRDHASQTLREGDRVEVVTLVGGG